MTQNYQIKLTASRDKHCKTTQTVIVLNKLKYVNM